MRYLIILLFTATSILASAQEFRGVWISTVFNTDWPSKSGLSTSQQKAELINQLDLHAKNGINAIFFQVRTSSDALYYSEIEPWSQWLSGKQGVAPSPFYDPLKFVIEEAHKRGMELHAWLNPYRAEINTSKRASTKKHISQIQPDWCISYGIRSYLDPGIPAVRDYIVTVVTDIVKRYDVDGIHFDDYFYPYKRKGEKFNDDKSFNKYGKNFNDRADWRRDNVNRTVNMLYTSIKEHDTRLKFGISPFGIWRNKREHPDGSSTKGMTNYHGLYADVRHWQQQGWVDYIIPQLYWPIGDSHADFKTLVDWWDENAHGRHIYIGLGLYNAKKNAKKAAWREPNQIKKQIDYLRTKSNIQGMCFFTSSSFATNQFNINNQLQTELYATVATTPSMPWKDKVVAAVNPTTPTTLLSTKNDTAQTITKANIASLQAPKNFRIIRQRNQVLFAWDDDDTAHKNKRYKIYRFSAKEEIVISAEKEFAETARTEVLVRRKKWAIFRKKFTFVVVAQANNKISDMSNEATMRFRKGETGPLYNAKMLVY